jgi:hypothetical protein
VALYPSIPAAQKRPFLKTISRKLNGLCDLTHRTVVATGPQKDNKMNATNTAQDRPQEEIPAQYRQSIGWTWLGAVRAKLVAVLVATACTFGTVQAASNIGNSVTGSNLDALRLHSGELPSTIPLPAAPEGAVALVSIPVQDSRYLVDFLTTEAPPAPLDPAPLPLVLFSLGFAAITYSRAPQHPPQKPLCFLR